MAPCLRHAAGAPWALARLAAATLAAASVTGGHSAAAMPAMMMRSVSPHGALAGSPHVAMSATTRGSVKEVVSAEQATAWLLEHRDPRHPLPSEEFLQRNTQFAMRAREELPAAATVPMKLFLSDVLPYLQVDEPLDEWRPSFYQVLAPHAQAATLQKVAEAVVPMVWSALRASPEVMANEPKSTPVVFRANCTPQVMAPISETLKAGYASCTGCSILVADALRSVGVPARVVGTPLWNVAGGGNHNWVEVWTGEGEHGGWHFFDAVPAETVEWDRAWFVPGNTQAAEAGTMSGIYAPVWDKAMADAVYPYTWRHPSETWPAVDRTAFYKSLQ
mmetsp:Transcript_59289/g.152632  ORF Transcript_59289/g.152632 Transcript_59289/m.152632 type:complete len:333 (+) Transcript_59289:154-1152(+)|eukprot:CAMPEP_0195064448 /NCGR_PEP_ID=MMETSP0448-20130528/10485_1 /TAXON_ID=66468 /ORGANISM="Heterocapsa triquestra, Strain CCMP 448" /LENGTH=332 /DNA_ID=CAMNT_0040095457 /DNA_START=95 /DNA_END=1093 /DNA_ORIENTATION=-